MILTGDTYPKFKVAAVQAAPAYIDRKESIRRVFRLTKEASSKGARLVVFGESFVPCFPVWNLVQRPLDQHKFYRLMYDNSVELYSDDFNLLSEAASENNVYLSVGITEKSGKSMGTMWNTNLLFSPEGRLLNVRRKLVPTWAEKLTWSNGDSSGLTAIKTDIGMLGVLICGENTNTLARFVLLAQGENLHIATFPTIWPFERPGSKEYNLTDAIRLRAAAHSFEGKVFTIVASCAIDEDALNLVSGGDEQVKEILTRAPPPVSAVFGPTGEYVAEPIIGKEGIVLAEIDLGECIKWKEIHDITGGYNRFDVFTLSMNRRSLKPLHISDSESEEDMNQRGSADVQTVEDTSVGNKEGSV